LFFVRLCINRSQQSGDDNWAVFEVKGDIVEGVHKGTGLDSMRDSLDEAKIQWAVINVIGVDQQDNVTSRRPKYVLVNWVGPRVPAMKRMGALSGKAHVAALLKGVQVTMDCNDKADLNTKTMAKLLLQCGGAHKPTFYDFGGGSMISVEEIYST